jgi:hypothetical protein
MFTGAVLGVTAGVGIVVHAPIIHTATSSLLVADAPVLISSVDRATDRTRLFTMDTEAQRIKADPVLDQVRRAAGPGLVPPGLTVSAVPNTTTLRVTVSARTAAAAIAGTDLAARTYLDDRGAMLRQRRDARIDQLHNDLARLSAQEARFEAQRSSTMTSVNGAAIGAQRHRDQQLILLTQATPVYPGTVIRAATSPATGPHNPTVPPASGLAIGGALGLAAFRWKQAGGDES